MGVRIDSKSVILCNGTFLNGLIHLGEKNYKGGRSGEPAAEGITKQLIDLGLYTWKNENRNTSKVRRKKY